MSSAGASTADHGGPPPRVRWPRRIAAVCATAALLGAGVATAMMIAGARSDERGAVVTVTPSRTPQTTDGTGRAGLTAAQRRARTAAVETLRSQGYVPVRASQYDPRRPLRVLVGYRSGDPLGPRRAFFFAGGQLLGTDAPTPSTGLRITGSGKRWVTLAYGIYTPGDRPCCPSGGRRKVRFALVDGALRAVGGTVPASWERVAAG